MKPILNIRIFIYAISVYVVSSCYPVQRFESMEFVSSYDTLCLDTYAYPLSRLSIGRAAKYNDSYYCLLAKSGAYPGMYDWGGETFMLKISGNNTTILQLPSPDEHLQWYDFFVRSDTLFWKDQSFEASYWDDAVAEWIPVEYLPDIVYEDQDWQVAVRNGGEFGVFTWFIDRHSDKQYIYPMLPEKINRIDSVFYLTGKKAITTLQNPRQGLLCNSDLRYENTLNDTEYRNSTSVRLSVNIICNGFQASMLPDTLLSVDSVELITSFSIDTTLYSVVNSKDRTFITSLTGSQLKEVFNFNEKFEFVDNSTNMKSRNLPESGVQLTYRKGKSEMGLLNIEDYSVHQLHLYYNPDTLTFSGNDHFKMVMNHIRDRWDTLSFHTVYDIESKTGSREVNSLIQNGYIPDSVKDRSIRRRFIQQVDSSLVCERSYWISDDNETVMACFVDFYLNDVYKKMPEELFESISDTIKNVMGCEAHRTIHKPRNCIMKLWETPTMVLEYYPYHYEDNIRIALWRKE